MVVHDVLSIELLAREVDLVKEVLGELLARTVAEVALRAPRDTQRWPWLGSWGAWCTHGTHGHMMHACICMQVPHFQ